MSDQPPPPPGPEPGFQQYGYGYGQAPGVVTYGGFWARFGAVFLDGLIVGTPARIIGAAISPVAGFVLQIVALLVYVAVLEGGPTGQTLGRRILSLRVVDATTLQPGIGPGRAIGRYFAKFLSGIVLGLGYFWMLWDPRKQTWHDKLASTVVVKA